MAVFGASYANVRDGAPISRVYVCERKESQVHRGCQADSAIPENDLIYHSEA